MTFERYMGEDENAFITRVCDAKDSIGTWEDIADILNDALGYNYSSSKYRKAYQYFNKMLDANQEKYANFENYKEEVEKLKFELLTERKKLQRINPEYYRNARQKADHELYNEMWLEAIQNQEPIKVIPTTKKIRKLEKQGLLLISDAHYGKEICLKGLDGEVINAYSPEVYKARMWRLLSDYVNDFEHNPVDKIIVNDLGDCIDGILRLGSSIQKLRVGVVDAASEYAKFMATWLCELWNRTKVPVEYSLIGGNHDVLRLLQQKSCFEDENMAKDILEKIELYVRIAVLEAKLNDKIVDIKINGYGDIVYNSFWGYNVLSYHGETKNMKDDIEFLENYYGISIDLLIGGHLHRSSSETIGFGYNGDREIMRVPSIVGMDTYAKSIRKGSRAGVKYIIFTEDGREWEKIYHLN